MARHSIEETFQAIRPKGWQGIPSPPVISVGVSSSNNDLSSSLSQAGQQIAQLQSAYQQQAAAVAANTQALEGNTSAQGSHSATSTVGSVASSFLGGSLGFLSPLISGIASLFGGGSSSPAPLPIYLPPAPVAIDATLQNATPSAVTSGQAVAPASSTPSGPSQPNSATNVTVNINAMDSQSFLDRSNDIASAVRAAMLNLHPINDVVASL
jgi:hypothetical protein